MFGLPNIQGDIAKAMQDAPHNFFVGLAQAAAFIPDKAKGVFLFGENIWNGYTPEQQATIEAALAKAILAVATAYIGSKA